MVRGGLKSTTPDRETARVCDRDVTVAVESRWARAC